jgi:exonuclease SbcC
MILLELEIEDFKQFRGKHLFTPTANGVVGIIGHNGAGKTTLFEAIEWCLYQPSDIKNADVPPRDAQDRRPRVRIRFTNSDGSTIWEVERSLRKSGAFAEVRQIDENGTAVLATGSTAVSNYVASKLIGLEYKAFVATFFTRQKELSFFGTYKPTDRRREVGRLLGLETLRSAQQLIAEERRARNAVYQGLSAQYQQQSGERDFAAERTARNEELAGIDQQLTGIESELIKAEAAFKAADAARAELVEQRERTLGLMRELATHQSAITAANTAIATATDELHRLNALEAERPALAEKAEQIPDCEQRVAGLESDRDRHQKRASLVEQRDQATREVVRLQESAKSALAAIQLAPGKPVTLREEDPLAEIDTALRSAGAVNADATDGLIREFEALAKEQERVAEFDATLELYRTSLTKLKDKHAALIAKGDVVEAEAASNEQRDDAVRTIATHQASIRTHMTTLADYRKFASRDQTPGLDSICQMCGRPISPDDLDHTRRHAEQRMAEIDKQVLLLRDEITRQETRISAIEFELSEIKTRAKDIDVFQERIALGQSKIAEAERSWETARNELDARRSRLSRTESVGPEEIAALVERRDCERKVERARVALLQTRESLATAIDRVRSLSGQIDEIGMVSFDPTELAQARSTLDAGRSARERIVFIDQQLLRRPEHGAAIETAESKRATARTEATRLESEIAANPIEEYALDKADMAVAKARQDEQRIRTQRENLRRGRLDVEHALRQIDADEKKLKELIDRAEKARVETEDLDRMYKEFNAFEQYVARRVRPQLEDMTSELVRVITENKYESVVLDDDYGVRVWDGELGPYPIEHFSGGERDVIALSARLALSRLIGSQAANPPSFLVLDEVFGSLDRDRRANVLDLLSSLAGSADAFQQLFVISHVDDVRLSPAFNEVWRVAESDDGSSRLENLNLTQGAEDL